MAFLCWRAIKQLRTHSLTQLNTCWSRTVFTACIAKLLYFGRLDRSTYYGRPLARLERSPLYFTQVSLCIFYSKQFVRHLSNDILETFPHDVDIAPVKKCYTDFLKVPLKQTMGQIQNLYHCPHNAPSFQKRESRSKIENNNVNHWQLRYTHAKFIWVGQKMTDIGALL